MKLPELSENLAEETGWHIGDGSMNFYILGKKKRGVYQLRGHIEDDRHHYLFRIKPLFEELYGLKINLREMPSTRVFGFQVWNDGLVKFKHDLGLPLGKKDNVIVPRAFVDNSKLRRAVLRGIFDTDGTIFLEKKNHKLYPRIEIRTISKELANQMKSFFLLDGLRATLYSQLYPSEFNRSRAYVVSIRGEEMLSKFIKLVSPENPKHLSKYQQFLDSKSF